MYVIGFVMYVIGSHNTLGKFMQTAPSLKKTKKYLIPIIYMCLFMIFYETNISYQQSSKKKKVTL